MHAFRPIVLATLLGCLPALGACSADHTSSNGIAADVGASVASALDKAQAKLRNEPITVSHNDTGLPKAEITPQGDFIVGGKTIAITPAQRSAALAYREKMIAVVSAGFAVGRQGAAIGIEAAGAAIAAAMSGQSDQEIEDRVKARTSGIRTAAAKVCDLLPGMMAEQQKLAAALPAFKPYATMTGKDVSECRDDALHDDDADDAARARTRQSVRENIRSGIQSAVQGAGLASRGTHDGAAASASSTAKQD